LYEYVESKITPEQKVLSEMHAHLIAALARAKGAPGAERRASEEAGNSFKTKDGDPRQQWDRCSHHFSSVLELVVAQEELLHVVSVVYSDLVKLRNLPIERADPGPNFELRLLSPSDNSNLVRRVAFLRNNKVACARLLAEAFYCLDGLRYQLLTAPEQDSLLHNEAGARQIAVSYPLETDNASTDSTVNTTWRPLWSSLQRPRFFEVVGTGVRDLGYECSMCDRWLDSIPPFAELAFEERGLVLRCVARSIANDTTRDIKFPVGLIEPDSVVRRVGNMFKRLGWGWYCDPHGHCGVAARTLIVSAPANTLPPRDPVAHNKASSWMQRVLRRNGAGERGGS
jgi:hypothetical protein